MAYTRRAPQKRKSRVAMLEDDDLEEDLSVPVLKEDEVKPTVCAQTVHIVNSLNS